MTENPDARSEPLVIDTFEGEYVRIMRGKLPAITLEMGEGFPRGTHVKLEVEARVRNVAYQAATGKEHKGELVREHSFVIEEVALLRAMTAEEADPGVGGSAGRLVEQDDFGDVVTDCWYDPRELVLYHRGSCALCFSRVPDETVVRTAEEVLPGAGRLHDPGF